MLPEGRMRTKKRVEVRISILLTSAWKTENGYFFNATIERRGDATDQTYTLIAAREFFPYLVIGFSLARCGGRKMIIRGTPVCRLLCLFGPRMVYLIRKPLFIVAVRHLRCKLCLSPVRFVGH